MEILNGIGHIISFCRTLKHNFSANIVSMNRPTVCFVNLCLWMCQRKSWDSVDVVPPLFNTHFPVMYKHALIQSAVFFFFFSGSIFLVHILLRIAMPHATTYSFLLSILYSLKYTYILIATSHVLFVCCKCARAFISSTQCSTFPFDNYVLLFENFALAVQV